VAVVAALVLVVGIATAVFLLRVVKPPIDAANSYFGDLKARRYGAAYGRLCEHTRRAVPKQEFVDALRVNLSGVYRIDDYAANPRVDLGDDRAEVDLEVSYAGTDNDDVTLRLRKDKGNWKPCPNPEQLG
jgi:HSP20 family molecular chaperone IbpA